MEFEKATMLRDKLKKLEAEKAKSQPVEDSGDGLGWDESKKDKALAAVNRKMEEATRSLQFEKCVKYRDAIKVLLLLL